MIGVGRVMEPGDCVFQVCVCWRSGLHVCVYLPSFSILGLCWPHVAISSCNYSSPDERCGCPLLALPPHSIHSRHHYFWCIGAMVLVG